MQKQLQLAFTGYHESKVKSALDTIRKNSKNFDVVVIGTPIKHDGQLDFQPKLREWTKKISKCTLFPLKELFQMQEISQGKDSAGSSNRSFATFCIKKCNPNTNLTVPINLIAKIKLLKQKPLLKI